MGALRDFVADLLESEGAAIEPVEPDGLEVLAPERLCIVMGWPEFARLGFAATLPAGAIPIGLEGDWLDRFGAILGERGRFAERQLVVADNIAAPNDPQRLLDHALDLPNAIWRLHTAKPTWTRCLLLAFRYTAISDEKRDGLVWVGFNQGTGAVLDGDFLRDSARAWRASRIGRCLSKMPAAPRAWRGMRQRSRRVLGDWLNIMSGLIWSLFSMPCNAGSTATADEFILIITIYAEPRRRNLPPSLRRPAKKPRPTGSARRCGSPPSSVSMRPNSTISATITICE